MIVAIPPSCWLWMKIKSSVWKLDRLGLSLCPAQSSLTGFRPLGFPTSMPKLIHFLTSSTSNSTSFHFLTPSLPSQLFQPLPLSNSLPLLLPNLFYFQLNSLSQVPTTPMPILNPLHFPTSSTSNSIPFPTSQPSSTPSTSIPLYPNSQPPLTSQPLPLPTKLPFPHHISFNPFHFPISVSQFPTQKGGMVSQNRWQK